MTLDPDAVQMLNDFCAKYETEIVVSSSWRISRSIEELQEILSYYGATYKVCGKTANNGSVRGVQVENWLYNNKLGRDFYHYAILDDDSDFLINQQRHFFKTDDYCGLTPNIVYKMERFFDSLREPQEIVLTMR